MKLTLSIIKADVGSIGSHTKPSERILEVEATKVDVAHRCVPAAGSILRVDTLVR